jgi:hypothetical protein
MFKISDTEDLPKTEDFLYEISNNHARNDTDHNQDDQKENQDEVNCLGKPLGKTMFNTGKTFSK